MENDSKKPKNDSNVADTILDASQIMDMPSVTRLLNRKSLSSAGNNKLSSPLPFSPGPKPSLEKRTLESLPQTSPPSGPHEILLSEDLKEPQHFEIQSSHSPSPLKTQEEVTPSSPEHSTGQTQPKIQPTARKPRLAIPPLTLWSTHLLKTSSDPLGKGISMLLQKGASSALFLSIGPPPPGSPVPHFLSTAAVQADRKLDLWTGLKWDPTVVPEMWNYFVRAGTVELSPPGSTTNQSSNRNVVRTAFGILQTEWLLIVRVGPANACRGVVAFVSLKSLLTDASDALPFLSAPYKK